MDLINNPKDGDERLNKLKKEFEEFVYIVSHDLKAPLRAVKNLSEWIEEDLSEDVSEDIKKNLDLLRSRTDWMNRMIDGLLDYSRISTKTQSPRNIEVEKFIKMVVDLLDIPQNIDIVVEVTKQNFVADHFQFKTVLEQLIQNAVKFNENESPKITVKAQDVSNGLELTVSDNGLGVEHENPQIAFEIFKTLHGKEKMHSVGVGLSIVKKIVENINGKIKLETEVGKGTSVQIFWPNATPQ